ITKWTFQEKNVLRVNSYVHHRANETQQHGIYRIKDELVIEVSISVYRDDKWQAYEAPKDDTLQVAAVMLDPYELKNMRKVKVLDIADGKALLYAGDIHLPDRHGVFTLLFDYKRYGYTWLEKKEIVEVRPFRHDDYPRFLSAAWVYYANVFAVMLGFVVISKYELNRTGITYFGTSKCFCGKRKFDRFFMAKSKYEYVKSFERVDSLLQNTYIVIRLDGHSFHRFTATHAFSKPNDIRALNLANACALTVLETYPDILLAYGQSDEFSFMLKKSSKLYKRRESKLVSNIVSLFTAVYVWKWKEFFGDLELQYPPSFDGRAVLYPDEKSLRDYFSWRQADCHINNLYNTAFWALVQDPKNPRTESIAQNILKDTDSAAKNEMLFKDFNVNYNNIIPIFRKGSVILRKTVADEENSEETGDIISMNLSVYDNALNLENNNSSNKRSKKKIKTKLKIVTVVEHCDIISDNFWIDNNDILKA
ncbi:tRNA-histidine guanylyltransferase 1-like, partial [Nowakowskiella sp. JEL0078]